MRSAFVTLGAANTRDLRSGLWLSGVSITWTGITSLIAIGYGLRAGSVVLAAFGAVGLFDLIGSTALVVHFRHALHHEAFSERHERVAHLVVAGGMVIVGVATLAASAIRLASSSHTDEPVVGLITAAASIAVLALLGHRKRVVGRRIPSAALVTDGWLSLTGASTAACAVVGLVLSDAYGWTWVDPTAALGVATAAIVTAIVSLRSAGSDSP